MGACCVAPRWRVWVSAQAQNYPERPIHLIVAFVPGGATDTIDAADPAGPVGGARPAGRRREPAGRRAATSPGTTSPTPTPDGYTLLMAENALAISQGLFKKAVVDVRSDQAIRPDRPGRDPRRSCSSSPTGQGQYGRRADRARALDGAGEDELRLGRHRQRRASHLRGVSRRRRHRGGAHSLQGRRRRDRATSSAGQVEMHMASIQVAAQLVKAGRLKALAVTGTKRSPALPDVPTLAEAGVKTADVDLGFWYAMFGPKGMPDDVKAKLDKAVRAVMSDPKVRERLAKLDIEPAYAPADVLAQEAQERDRELDQVHRRQGHQGGVTHRHGADSYRPSTPCLMPGRRGCPLRGHDARWKRHEIIRSTLSRGVGSRASSAAHRPGLLQQAHPHHRRPGRGRGDRRDGAAGGAEAHRSACTPTSMSTTGRAGSSFRPPRSWSSADPDGHTLLMISTSNVVTQPLHPDYPFDLRALTPVTEVSDGPLILVARKDLPIKSVADLIAYAKPEPRQAHLRVGRRHRQLALSRDRAVAAQDRHQAPARALSRRGGRAQRPARRPHRPHVRRHAGDVAAGQGRQRDAARGDERQALAGRCPTCRPWWRPACRISRW